MLAFLSSLLSSFGFALVDFVFPVLFLDASSSFFCVFVFFSLAFSVCEMGVWAPVWISKKAVKWKENFKNYLQRVVCLPIFLIFLRSFEIQTEPHPLPQEKLWFDVGLALELVVTLLFSWLVLLVIGWLYFECGLGLCVKYIAFWNCVLLCFNIKISRGL